MRAVVQRVNHAEVSINDVVEGTIDIGLLVFLGIEQCDGIEDVEWLCGKLSRMRVFPDENGLMNLDIIAVSGAFLVVSQFTLFASTKKGNRPGYIRAARPETAIPLYEKFIENLKKESGLSVQTGVFGAMMNVSLVNSGPVTIIIDSRNKE